ncbi:hypothetical protein D0809_12110 [Flavobacterium circumlabens]|uniref:PorT family protein n=1 Tax=Flavobacterium circumlabens TaxID=2133765 RepID=A0A4Y7UE56_9FLAO|nr:hypothetical protein [Flavobacterium circumlabens]TEB44481.1 hypothetical protein D0809_12110 [Flavobacterium circumlabens]
MIKKILFFLLVLFCIKSNAQHARVFANISAYLHSDFQNNSFSEFGTGLEVKVHRFLKPEVGVSYFIGSLEDYSKVDQQGNTLDLRTSKVYALNFNLTPKISLYSKEVNSGDVFIQILPRFNVSKISADRYYTVINPIKPSASVTTKETVSEWYQSFGIGLGIDIVLSDKSYDSLSVNLYYNGVNMGKALTEVNHSNSRINTDTVGMGISYYLGFEKKKN